VPDKESLLWERAGQKPMLQCPWCEEWAPKDSYTTLNMPPAHQDQLSTIYKHPGKCGMLFALRGEA